MSLIAYIYIWWRVAHDSRARLSIALTMSVIWHFRFFELIARERKRNEREKKNIIRVCVCMQRTKKMELVCAGRQVIRIALTKFSRSLFFLRWETVGDGGGRWGDWGGGGCGGGRFCCSLLFAEVIGQSNVCIKCVFHSIWETCPRPHCPQ